MSRLWEDLAVLRATSVCKLNLAVLRLAILLVVLCRSDREIWRFQAVAGNLLVSGFRVAVSGENWRGSGKFGVLTWAGLRVIICRDGAEI